MSVKKRRFTKEFKLHVLGEIRSGKSQAEVSRQYQILPQIISRWQTEYESYADEAFAGAGNTYTDKAHMAALERKLSQLEAENELLKKALTQLDLIRSSGKDSGEQG